MQDVYWLHSPLETPRAFEFPHRGELPGRGRLVSCAPCSPGFSSRQPDKLQGIEPAWVELCLLGWVHENCVFLLKGLIWGNTQLIRVVVCLPLKGNFSCTCWMLKDKPLWVAGHLTLWKIHLPTCKPYHRVRRRVWDCWHGQLQREHGLCPAWHASSLQPAG